MPTSINGRHSRAKMNHQTTVNGEFRRYIEPQSVPSGQGTVGTAIRHYADLQPDHPAVVSSAFAPLSYRELQCQIDAARAALRRAGLGRSARVAVAMPNGPQAALAIVAVSCAAVCIPLNPRQTLPEIEKCLAAVRPDAIVLMKGEEFRRQAGGRGLRRDDYRGHARKSGGPRFRYCRAGGRGGCIRRA